ncbi:MAG: TIGR00282 family metallophosphoesterase [Candidatus Zixiibacteriota bacterium]
MSAVTVMFVADICGQTGRQAAATMIKPIRERYGIDYVIANVENAAGGFGITPEMSRKAFSYGIDIQTSGNHIWDRYEIVSYLKDNQKLLRPANFPSDAPGKGTYVDTVGGVAIGIVNLMGRVYMKDIDCPFQVARRQIELMRNQTPIIIVDFHAEATSEKQAMAYYLDGKVSAVLGTHTHVQTADEQISQEGTAYITDVGMTGPHDSIIGMQKEPSLFRFLTGMPKRFATATDDVKLSAVLLKIESSTGVCQEIQRLRLDFNPDDYRNQEKKDAADSKDGEATVAETETE